MQTIKSVRKQQNTLTDGSIVFNVIIADSTFGSILEELNGHEMVIVDCQDEKNADELVRQLLIAGFALKGI
jgi:hypothetical protein